MTQSTSLLQTAVLAGLLIVCFVLAAPPAHAQG